MLEMIPMGHRNYSLDQDFIMPVGWGSTLTDVGVGVSVLVCISVTPITKGTPAQFFLGRHVYCSLGHWP